MTIKNKLISLVVLLLTLLTIVAGHAIVSMKNIASELHGVTAEDMPLMEVITEVTIRQFEGALVMERTLGAYRKTANDDLSNSKNELNSISKNVTEQLLVAENILSTAIEHASSTEIKDNFVALLDRLTEIEHQHTIYEEHLSAIVNALESGSDQALEEKMETLEAELSSLDHNLEEFLLSVEELTNHALESVEMHEQQMMYWSIGLVIAAMFIGVSGGIYIIHSIMKPLGAEPTELLSISAKIAGGDLTSSFADAGNETGVYSAIRTMNTNLAKLVLGIQDVSKNLAGTAQHASDINDQTHVAMCSQQQETGQVATAVNEMASTTQEVASNAAETAEATVAVLSVADEGKKVLDQAIISIETLSVEVSNTSKLMQQLKEHGEAIGSVLAVIEGIAEQTNLLALNAAIEAARAGEQGRGFAVVADEVRSLAQRTQTSTVQIKEMIDKIQTGTDISGAAIEKSRAQAAETVTLVSEVGGALTKTNEGISKINDMNTQVATAAEEQTAVIEEINRNIVAINQRAEETSSGSKNTKDAGDKLVHLADELQQSVSRFKLST